MLHKTTQRTALALIASCTLLAISATAYATVARYMDMTSLVKRADVIVQGKAIKQQVHYDKTRKLSLLRTTIKVDKVLMGTSAKSITIQQIGGTHNGVTTHISGDASFEIGEEVVLFLNKDKKNMHYLNAMGQSKYTVSRTGTTVSYQRDLSGFTFVKPGERNIQPITDVALKNNAFHTKLRTIIKKLKAAKKEKK